MGEERCVYMNVVIDIVCGRGNG